ncbi:MAG TPA: hypothetical protein DCZ12_02070, partial [Gammaproteobacteria bacterium]|nr:hypothetical protein [Gammaproteobacteria bacterium]
MTAALYLTTALLAIVSGARTVLWLTSYASTKLDTALATASAIGLTLAMYLLAAVATKTVERTAVAGLFILSAWATFDWAETGYQTVSTTADTSAYINTQTRSLIADTSTATATQNNNAATLSAIGHNTRSDAVTSNTQQLIDTRMALIDSLRAEPSTTHTGHSAALLGNGRLILWLLLAVLLDGAGILCLRKARELTTQHTEHTADPLQQQIADEIRQGIHGKQPAVINVAKAHSISDDHARR